MEGSKRSRHFDRKLRLGTRGRWPSQPPEHETNVELLRQKMPCSKFEGDGDQCSYCKYDWRRHRQFFRGSRPAADGMELRALTFRAQEDQREATERE